MREIDLRSDTVTKPSREMLDFMMTAEVGDDVYGEDPSVNFLERKMCSVTGMESAVFAPSGTQTNLIALLAHCSRGDEYIVGQQGHTYKYEGGGAAVLGGIQPQPLDYEPDATLNLDKVAKAIKPLDNHFARTRLLCLENTQAGRALPTGYLPSVRDFCDSNKLALHLDGARIFNAAIDQDVDIRTITRCFDSVSICLSKGLGSPVGSVLCGSGEIIARARRWRKVVGGGMRQSGYLAACGIYALDHNIRRIGIDHDNAHRLAAGLGQINELNVKNNTAHTNMVFLEIEKKTFLALKHYLNKRSIRVGGYGEMRLVTHLGITKTDIDTVVDAFADFFR